MTVLTMQRVQPLLNGQFGPLEQWQMLHKNSQTIHVWIIYLHER